MSTLNLTSELLTALSVPEIAAQEILSAHAADLAALTAQCDQLLEDRTAAEAACTRAKAELEQYKADQLAAQQEAAVSRAIRHALLEAGANPQAVPLLEKEIPHAEAQLTPDGTLINAEALIAPLKERYAGLFATVECIPAPSVEMPTGPEAMTPADLSGMSAEAINRNWQLVRAALSNQ